MNRHERRFEVIVTDMVAYQETYSQSELRDLGVVIGDDDRESDIAEKVIDSDKFMAEILGVYEDVIDRHVAVYELGEGE